MADSEPELMVVGMGGHARVVASIARAQGYKVRGFLDAFDDPSVSADASDLPLLGGISRLREMDRPCVAIGIGDNHLRHETVQRVSKINETVNIVSTIHPQSCLEEGVSLGAHVTVCVRALVCVEAQLSDGVLVNSGAIVDHECVLERYCHISPGAQLGGRVRVGEFTWVGIGATVIHKVHIGTEAMIGAGAVVINDIPDYATAVGVPAKVIKVSEPEGER